MTETKHYFVSAKGDTEEKFLLKSSLQETKRKKKRKNGGRIEENKLFIKYESNFSKYALDAASLLDFIGCLSFNFSDDIVPCLQRCEID